MPAPQPSSETPPVVVCKRCHAEKALTYENFPKRTRDRPFGAENFNPQCRDCTAIYLHRVSMMPRLRAAIRHVGVDPDLLEVDTYHLVYALKANRDLTDLRVGRARQAFKNVFLKAEKRRRKRPPSPIPELLVYRRGKSPVTKPLKRRRANP